MNRLKFFCKFGGNHPVAGEVWYRLAAAEGDEAERYDRYICAAVLGLTLHYPDNCDELLRLLESVLSGKASREVFGYNDTEITFERTGVQIDILIADEFIDDPAGRFDTEQFRSIVLAWKDFLSHPESADVRAVLELQ